LLGAQHPRSAEPDELLFIVVHQACELWFKELLQELRLLRKHFQDSEPAGALHRLHRGYAIVHSLAAQLDVLETMPPQRFAAFRGALGTASGFQSIQFRELEAVLGRRDRQVYEHHPDGEEATRRVSAAMAEETVFDAFLHFLADAGYPVPRDVLDRDVRLPAEPSAEVQRVLRQVYADDGIPAQVAERMVDLDGAFGEWRYRHVRMVQRMIGSRTGTGGSSGTEYLFGKLSPAAFPDLWAMRNEMRNEI
jgi:tryptophan 2,3-dioxygenase